MEDTQATTIRLPVPLYQRLRRQAFETNIPMNQIIIAAISAAMEKTS
jgi:hypothetical protein